MYKFKLCISIIFFSLLLVGTSIIKNETRDLEKKIDNLNEHIVSKEKDLNETQLDFFYLTSPYVLEQRIQNLDINIYIPMKHSNIFLSFLSFVGLQNKFVIQEIQNEKKIQKR